MQFLFGLGNPGEEYQKTRHNMGFLFVDHFLTKKGIIQPPQDSSKFTAQFWKEGQLVVGKPQTYMNRSGQAVRSLIEYYDKTALQSQKTSELSLPQVVVAFDDLDIPVGSWKLQLGTGPKIHNGVNSVYEHLGTKQFMHLRLGVDGRNGDRTIPSDRYVLSSFSSEEQPLITRMLEDATQAILKHFASVQ